MILEFLDYASSEYTLILLIVALGIFGGIALQSRNVKSFQFHMSIFIMLWIIGEVIGIFVKAEIVDLGILESVGHQIHLVSMAVIGIIFWLRFYYAKKEGKKFIDEIPS